MVWLLICFGCALDEVLAGLAHRARESSRRVRAPSEDESSYEPGFYDINGISFTLRSRVIGHTDASILGYAATSSVLALLSNPIDADSILVDEEQRLLRVGRMFTTDQDVLFYNISVESPLVVFGNLRFRTTANNAPANNNRRVGDTRKIAEGEIFQWPAPIEQQWTFNWDTRHDRPKETTSSGFSYVFGGKLYAVAWADWQFAGTSYLRVNTGFDIRGQIETGLKIPADKKEKFAEEKVKEECSELHHNPPANFAGLRMRGRLSVCANLSLKGGPSPGAYTQALDYRRPWTLRAVRSGLFKTSGSIFAPQKFELAKLKEVGTASLVKFDVKPSRNYGSSINSEVDLYGKTTFTIAKETWFIKLGVKVPIEWTFSARPDACVTPHLYVSERFKPRPFHEHPQVTVAGSTLLQGQSRETFYDLESNSIEGCVFSNFDGLTPTEVVAQAQQEKAGVLPSLTFKQGERYGSIEFKDVPLRMVRAAELYLYALVNLDDCTPTVDAQHLGNGLWAVRVAANVLRGGSLVLKVHRRSAFARTYPKVGVEKLFYGPPEVFCRDESSSFKVVVTLSAGCVAPTWMNGRISGEWDARVGGELDTKQVLAVKKINSFELQDVDSVTGWGPVNTIAITRNQYVLESEALLTVLPRLDLKALYAHGSRLNLRGSSAYFYCDGVGKEVPFGGAVVGCGNSGYLVAHSSSSAAVLQVFRMKVDGISLVEYADRDGLVQVEGQLTYFHPGFKRQVVRQSSAYVYKTWSGKPQKTILPNDDKTELHVRAKTRGDKWVLFLTLVSGNSQLSLPWGVKSYSQNPNVFFEGLGITTTHTVTKYRADEVIFTQDGEIEVQKNNIHLSKIPTHGKNILGWLDLDSNGISWQVKFEMIKPGEQVWTPWDDGVAEEQVVNGLEADSLMLIEVAVGAFVGALIITLVGVLVYRRRLRANEKSSSTVSDGKSSDDICQEGLIETGE